MKNLVKWLIPIVAVIIIILIILLVLLLNAKPQPEDNQNYIAEDFISGDLYNYAASQTQEVLDANSFYTVANCVSSYLDKINTNNTAYYGTDENGNEVKTIDDNTIAQIIIDTLDVAYVQTNNITTANVYEYVEKVNQKEMFTPLKMNILPGKTTEKYAVYGITQDISNNFIRELYIIVTLDVTNYTYSIEPLINKTYKSINEISLANTNTPIQKNIENQFQYEQINNGYISNKCLESFKKMVLSIPEFVYNNYLNETYKNAKFATYQAFEQWLSTTKNKIATSALKEYSVIIKDNKTQYICIDQNGSYYIFEQTAPMQYKVILDTYTIDLPEFLQKYEMANEEEKVLLNIEKVFQAINQADYQYVYNKLDATFKANNFATLEQFETYMKQNFYEKNKVSAGKAQKQNDIYMYTITINDATGQNQNTITKNFVMQLNQGTNFTMSFQV